MFRPAHCSLYLLCSLERVGGIPLFFPFHYNTSELDEIPLKGNARGGEYTKCLRGSNYEYNGPNGCRWNLQMH